MRFTVEAEKFEGLIAPKNGRRITVKAIGGGRTAARSGSKNPVLVSKEGGDFGVYGSKK